MNSLPNPGFVRLNAAVAALLLAAACISSGAEPLKPRGQVIKPSRIKLDPKRDSATRIELKLRDDVPVRLRGGKLDDAGSRALEKGAPLFARLARAGAKWHRQHHVPEELLDDLRANAQRNTGRVTPDLNTSFIVELPPGDDLASVIDELNALDVVELASPAPMPVALPVVPSFVNRQNYLEAAPVGVDAEFAWGGLGGTGVGIQIADIEYDWNFNHADFSARALGPARVVPAVSNGGDHGTAVLGILGGARNNFGVTGIAYNSQLYGVAANTASGYNVAAAITTALGTLRAGDIIVLEQQCDGPFAGNADFCPIEWIPSVYNAIVTAVGNGITVVEAAGNGNQNLDDPAYDTGHRPFTPGFSSGAIIVGAGGAPDGTDGDRSRLQFSSYGFAVDLQGWGERVVTTGYGGLHSSDGTNNFYTAFFNGTSSATPVVAGACALLQAAYKATHGQTLWPWELRALLIATGSPQLAGTHPVSEHIGPRPNLRYAKAVLETGPVWLDFYYGRADRLGTFYQPFNSVPEAAAGVPAGGYVLIKPGGSRWAGTINYNKPMTLLAVETPVTIGQ